MVTVSQVRRWLIAEPAPPEHLRRYRGISPVLAQVLYNRGFTDPSDADRFLYTKRVDHSPFELEDMQKAVGRIRTAIKRGELIAVYGDFDADGVTSTAVMMEALTAFGARAIAYIPRRLDEGYGLNVPALHELARQGVKLVITVDCGIRAVDEVAAGKAAGLDIIITDHHSLGDALPDAYAVINPKRAGYPEDMLAGVGVAFKVAQALVMAHRKNGGRGRPDPLAVERLLDLVAIGTVADIMPLNRLENRAFVRRGLEVLNRAERPGIRALLSVAGLNAGELTAGSIGFALGPRINAAGRLDDAMIAYRLLTAPDDESAQPFAERLQALNTKRQEITRAAQEKINQTLALDSDTPLIFASDPSFEPGIVGLVAGRLTEEYFLPAVVMEQGDTESRASCRSIPGFDITAALDRCSHLLARHGGHALAAGFTVVNENIPALRDALLQIARAELSGKELAPTLEIDAALDLSHLSEELVNELALLEPTGNANRPPVFAAHRVTVHSHRTVGKDASHLKLTLARDGQPPLDAIGFGLGHWADRLNGAPLDVAFQVEINEWNGRRSLQLRLQDVREAQG